MKLIIFDFDGVLREITWQDIYDAYIKLAMAMGKDPKSFFTNLVSFQKWYDIDWHNNEMRIMGEEVYQPRPEFNRIFHEHFDPTLKLFPWTETVLKKLSEKYILAILSSSTKESVKKELGELTKYFSHITGAEEVKSLKPSPEGVLLTLSLTKTSSNDALMIGDMNVDFLAGNSVGTKTGLVKWGMGDWEDLVALNPDYLFEKPEDLLSL